MKCELIINCRKTTYNQLENKTRFFKVKSYSKLINAAYRTQRKTLCYCKFLWIDNYKKGFPIALHRPNMIKRTLTGCLECFAKYLNGTIDVYF